MGNTGRENINSSSLSLGQNIIRIAKIYPLDEAGRLGVKDVGSNAIVTSTPSETAKAVLQQLTIGGKLKETSTEALQYFKFPKSSDTVIFRPVSADGSPAISINAKSHFGQEYKIHFVVALKSSKGK